MSNIKNNPWCSKKHDVLLGHDVAEYINQSLDSLLLCDFTGYDPGSYYASQILKLKSKNTGVAARIQNKLVHTTLSWGGATAIKLMRLPKVKSTKAIALTAVSLFYMRSSQPQSADMLESKAGELLFELEQRQSPSFEAWPPDFNYEIQGASITRENVGTINTVFCAEAFWLWRGQNPRSLDVLFRAARELLVQLPRHENEDVCCFSYNPSTKYYVHNANLFIALLLARLRSEGIFFEANSLPEKCARFLVEDFEKTGTLRYAGEPTPNNTVDNYHTGFVLRALGELREYIADASLVARIDAMIDHGLHMYVRVFSGQGYIRKFSRERYKVQAHSVAEAFLMYKCFQPSYPELFGESYVKAVRSSFFALWNKETRCFDSEVAVLGKQVFWRNTAPMPRWAWAWMLLGLAR